MPITRSSRPEVFCKKDVLRNFTKFTGKHLCQNLFFNKIAGLRQNTSGDSFWVTLNANKVLNCVQTPPCLLLDGWSEQTEVYTGISKYSPFNCVLESTLVSYKQIMSILWAVIHAFKRDILTLSWTVILLKFQWQMDQKTMHFSEQKNNLALRFLMFSN